jgi:hypothetical protein
MFLVIKSNREPRVSRVLIQCSLLNDSTAQRLHDDSTAQLFVQLLALLVTIILHSVAFIPLVPFGFSIASRIIRERCVRVFDATDADCVEIEEMLGDLYAIFRIRSGEIHCISKCFLTNVVTMCAYPT